jgi:uncharacterized membrane protein required for colicin V production
VSPSSSTDRFPTWAHILLIFVGMVILGVSACVGFLSTLNFNGGTSPVNTAFGFFFGVAVLGVLLDVVLVVWRLIRGSQSQP